MSRCLASGGDGMVIFLHRIYNSYRLAGLFGLNNTNIFIAYFPFSYRNSGEMSSAPACQDTVQPSNSKLRKAVVLLSA